MVEKNLRLRDWMEPAHPGIIKQYEDLLSIYRVIKDKYQKAIDNAFDSVSRKIGFVVTTTIPMMLEIDEKGKVTNLSIGGDNLRGTLFEGELQNALKNIKETPIKATAGKYSLYAIWYDALKLKLKTDWMEPAHFKKPTLTTPALTATAIHGSNVAVRPEVMEPAHWFDPQVILQPEEAVLISVIDEVYPELNLASRISAIRNKARVVRPEVMEPAHFRLSEQLKDNPAELLKAVKELLEKYS